MADRLTQLQDAVNQQADNFTNSLGILQQSATPTPFQGISKSKSDSAGKGAADNADKGNAVNGNSAVNGASQLQQQEDHTNLFAQLIARTAKDIELLIDSLPSEESSLQLQEASLIELEKHNSEAAQKLEDVVKQGEAIRQEIQSALHDVAQQQLEIQKLET